MKHPIEQIDATTVQIVHPHCGGLVLITELVPADGVLYVEAICYRCNRYVRMEYRTHLTRELPSDLSLRAATDHAIVRALGVTGNNVTQAAKLLGRRRGTIYQWMRRGKLGREGQGRKPGTRC